MRRSKYTYHIDTTDSSQTRVGIQLHKEIKWYTKQTDRSKSQNLLPLIEKTLKYQKITLNDIRAIQVTTNQGSFTGIRVGVSIANVLGWVLKIPVNDKKILHPTYVSSKFDEELSMPT